MSNLINLQTKLARLSRELNSALVNGDDELYEDIEDEIAETEFEIEELEKFSYDDRHNATFR